MKTQIKLQKWNDETESFNTVENVTLSQALLLLDESSNYQLLITDADSTGELTIQNCSSFPEVTAYNY